MVGVASCGGPRLTPFDDRTAIAIQNVHLVRALGAAAPN
jgi:hypothetical protein